MGRTRVILRHRDIEHQNSCKVYKDGASRDFTLDIFSRNNAGLAFSTLGKGLTFWFFCFHSTVNDWDEGNEHDEEKSYDERKGHFSPDKV